MLIETYYCIPTDRVRWPSACASNSEAIHDFDAAGVCQRCGERSLFAQARDMVIERYGDALRNLAALEEKDAE